MRQYVVGVLALIAGLTSGASCSLQFLPETVNIACGSCVEVVLNSIDENLINKTITLTPEFPEIAQVNPSTIRINKTNTKNWTVQVCGYEAGYTVISASVGNNDSAIYYLHVLVGKVPLLKVVSDIFGWIYFFAWSISFYPQMYENYVRKSVVGLNFDFIALNVVGFVLYSLFNCGLYYIPALKKEYFQRHPNGLNPVQFNDVFFSVHATFAMIVVIIQCIMYERQEQKVSLLTKSIMGLYYVIVFVTGLCAYMDKIHWLDFLYYCSYIKLSITLIKYIPQAVMNYNRKSTVGWSIGNVLLDFTGGIFSMLQMIISGYNYDDWGTIFGDPTKFGLGLFSVFFDIFFMYQHYILYRRIPNSLLGEKLGLNQSSVKQS